MRLKVALSLLPFFAAASGFAQAEVFVRFPNAGDREIWIAKSLPVAAPKDTVITRAAQVNFPNKGHAPSEIVFVWDKATGNIAARKLADVKRDAEWRVRDEDYKYVATVRIKVELGGKPLDAADIRADDGSREQAQLLDPSMKGVVDLFGIKPGDLKVTVNYRSGGTMATPVTQIIPVALKRPEPVSTLAVALPSSQDGDTPVSSDEPSSSGSEEKSEEKPKDDAPKEAAKEVPGTQPANPLGSFVVVLLGLGIVGALVYFALKYAKQNQDEVADKLKQLGVQVPTPGDDPNVGSSAAPVVPAAPAKPEPPQKIILSDAAPDPVAPPAAMPPPAGPTGVPKLIAENGDAFELPEGETIIGRDLGLGLSLVGESTVSRQHARVVKSGASLMIRDLGSTNGTFLNGLPLVGETNLSHGDAVQFGAVKFRYEA